MEYSCEQIKELLPTYVDNMTNRIETDIIKEHLKNCAECRLDYEFLKGITETSQNLPFISVSDAFNKKLHQKLVSEKNRKRRETLSALKRVSSVFLSSAAIIAISVVSLNVLESKDNAEIHPRTIETASPFEASEMSKGIKAENGEELNVRTADSDAPADDVQTQDNVKEEAHLKAEEAKNGKRNVPIITNSSGADESNKIATARSLPSEASFAPSYDAQDETSFSSSRASQQADAISQKVKLTVTVALNENNLSQANEILSDITYYNGKYIVSRSQYKLLAAKFDEIGAQVSFEEEDKTDRYASLSEMLDSASDIQALSIKEQLGEIDNEVSNVYIVLK